MLIQQDAADNDVFFVLTGAFNVLVNGHIVARRFANDHVGEMAAVEMTQKRAASIVATELSVVAQIPEAQFSTIGSKYPEVYLAVARELSRRLHQRNAHVGAARDRIKVFVISSKNPSASRVSSRTRSPTTTLLSNPGPTMYSGSRTTHCRVCSTPYTTQTSPSRSHTPTIPPRSVARLGLHRATT